MKDLIDLIAETQEKLEEMRVTELAKRGKLDTDLLLANCLALLKDIPTTNLSNDKRLRLNGLRTQLSDALRKVA